MNAVGTLWIFFLMVLMTADVAGRNLLNAPIRGVLEITTLSIVSIVYLQLADTLRNGQLTRSDGWLTALRLRRGRLAAVLQGAFHLVGAMFVGLICVASVPLLVEILGERRIPRRNRRFPGPIMADAGGGGRRVGLHRPDVPVPGRTRRPHGMARR